MTTPHPLITHIMYIMYIVNILARSCKIFLIGSVRWRNDSEILGFQSIGGNKNRISLILIFLSIIDCNVFSSTKFQGDNFHGFRYELQYKFLPFLPHPAGSKAANRVGPKIVLDHVHV